MGCRGRLSAITCRVLAGYLFPKGTGARRARRHERAVTVGETRSLDPCVGCGSLPNAAGRGVDREACRFLFLHRGHEVEIERIWEVLSRLQTVWGFCVERDSCAPPVPSRCTA